MLNPFGSEPVPGSYVNLQKRMLKKVQATGVNEQIIEMMQKSFENALADENIVLSRPERKRLLGQIIKLALEDRIKKLADGSISI